MLKKLLISLISACVMAALVSCGKNDSKEPQGDGVANQAAADYTDYGSTSTVNGQVGQAGQSYGPCPNDPTQVCVQNTTRSCSRVTVNQFNQPVPQCQNNGGTQVVRVVPIVPIRVLSLGLNDGQQIQYNHNGTCQYQNEILGSFAFDVFNNSQTIELEWNHFVPRGPADPAVQFYRVIVYGDKSMNPGTSWISPKLSGNSVQISAGSIGSFSAAFPQIQSENRPLSLFVPWIPGQVYWFDIVAFTADGQPALNHQGVKHRRHFDARLTSCQPTVVAGFCN